MATILSDGPTMVSTGSAKLSAVSWPAVFAGALVAIATTLILLALGTGLGFAAISPWPGAGTTITKFAIGVGVWLIVTQWLSSALGGYITGRFRSHWHGVHSREVLFRDTANGLVAWALSTVVMAAIAFSASAATLNATTGTAQIVASATDVMLRSDRTGEPASASFRAEVIRILGQDGPMAASDSDYLARQIAVRTGISPAQAQARVDTATVSIREAADKARKISSAVGFFTSLSMLIGAFIACVAAAYGGALRDEGEREARAA